MAGCRAHPEVSILLELLSKQLAAITGRDGKASFAFGDVTQPRSVFHWTLSPAPHCRLRCCSIL